METGGAWHSMDYMGEVVASIAPEAERKEKHGGRFRARKQYL